jgi:LacI family transcriptional regulator
MAANDDLAIAILESCQRHKRSVPDDIALLGVNNSALQCETAAVPVSSVDPDIEAAAFKSAELLARLMKGQAIPALTVIPPRKVVERQSTDALSFEDKDFSQAVRFMRERSIEGTTVNALLKRVPLSRSTLERMCRTHMGHGPGREMQLIRLRKARELMLETRLSMVEIAVRSGFSSISYLSQAFKAEYGQTPRDFRKTIER